MKRARRHQGRAAFDLIEEATHVLRSAPAATLATYYLGALPFVLGLLYFWADMSRSPFAREHLPDSALGLGALFLWMKFWQAVFARRIRAQIAAEPLPPLKLREVWNIAVTQTILQPLGLFAVPLALVPAIPFAWVFCFFQNVTALAQGADADISRLFKKSYRQAVLWPLQNHYALAILFAFALCVYLNWAASCLVLPGLLKMLLGMESTFSKSPSALLNSTFFAGIFGLTYLCVDPILKTFYALRCFYGQSLESGEDLKAELRSFTIQSAKTAGLMLILLALSGALQARAETSPATAGPALRQSLSLPALDQAINQTLQARKYVWRMPRPKVLEAESREGLIAAFFDKVGAMLRRWARATVHWLEEVLQKLFPHRRPAPAGDESSGYGWIMGVEILLYGLVAALLAALVIFVFRVWRGRRRAPTAEAQAFFPVPDVADENVRADQLPEEGWTKLARELLERGEFRLAMRAFYLASLAHLAARDLIRIAGFKSNFDYERELRRRAHAIPQLLSVFGENILAFERVWYGVHEVDRESLSRFVANLEKLKAAE